MKLTLESGVGSPSLLQAFPSLFTKSTPVIERKSPLIYAASLLRFRSVEAAMILMERERPMRIGSKIAFVGGYSILITLQKAKPDHSYKALFEPSDRSAVGMTPVKSSLSLRDLLRVFREGKFGFTAVTDGGVFAMVGLSDILELYRKGTLGSDLTVRDVASRKVSVSRHTPMREALDTMIERRIRRVFIEGSGAFVSDREVVSSIFSPRKLKEIKHSPRSMLEGTVLEFGPVEAAEVEGDMPLKEAALVVAEAQGGALVCDKGVVSPWDVGMKPFAAGHLNVR